VHLGARTVKLTQLREELDRIEVSRPVPRAAGVAGARNLEPRWTRPTAYQGSTRSLLQTAVHAQEELDRPVLPTFFPLLVGDKVVYRSYRGLHAVDVRTGQEAWAASSAWSIDRMLAEPLYVSHLESWIDAYLDVSPHVLYGNAVLGTLGSDGARIYAVDDLAVPPYRSYSRPRRRWQEPMLVDFEPTLTEAIQSNRLLALDAATGQRTWEIVGRADHYFLGPPLPVEGRLYALTEKNHELALVCLSADHGTLLWRQPLAYAPTPLVLDPGRRLQAVFPAYAEGVLVCPTNAGLVLGVDVLGSGLAWAHPYRSAALTEAVPSTDRRRREVRTRIAASWQLPRTLVAQGKVVIAAADNSSIQCLDLHNGSLLWEAGWIAGDLYLAGILGGRVLLVGSHACRVLDLANGKQVWQVETGEPSGQGTASGNVYYLPLKEAGPDKKPALWAIDVLKGAVTERLASPQKEVPGNLLLAPGAVFSQTATAVTVYPAR
jgi:outer membrane protein assembly factor BamB